MMALDGLVEKRKIAPSQSHHLHRRVLNLPLRRFNVTGICPIIGGVLCHQSNAIGTGGVKAGSIQPVRLMGQHHGVQTEGIQLGTDRGKMIH